MALQRIMLEGGAFVPHREEFKMAWWNPWSDDTGKTLSPKKAAEQKDVTDRDTSRIYSMYKPKPMRSYKKEYSNFNAKEYKSKPKRILSKRDKAIEGATGWKPSNRKGDMVKNYVNGGGVRPASNEYE